MELLIATRNPGKVLEFQASLAGLPVTLTSGLTIAGGADISEDADTIAGNALLKARHYWQPGRHVVGDDSGIFVEALPGELGVKTRRWGLGPDVADEPWIAHFLERMSREQNKRARFVCTLAYLDAEGGEHLFDGIVDGIVTDTLEGGYPPGLPFDGCFRPDGYDGVFSTLTIEQKNSTSHRGRALTLFRDHLARSIGA